MNTSNLTRRQALAGMIAGTSGVLLGTGVTAKGDRPAPPNFVFVLVDDQAWNAVGYSGRFPFLQTPNMDRLAREGVRFENAFVTTSLCSPSRACFLTGYHAHRHGVRGNDRQDPDPAMATFPQVLQAAGYETAFVGKWHMAPTARPRPGFDYWLSFKGQGKYVNPALNENGRDFQRDGYMTDLLTEYAVDWLKQPREKPFCLLLWHKAVHGPFTPAPRHADAFPDVQLAKPPNFDDTLEDKPKWQRHAEAYGKRRKEFEANRDKETPEKRQPDAWEGGSEASRDYLRCLLAVDDSLGAVLDTLEALGQLDRTVVVFSSDNGFFLGEHGLGDKRLMYEESIRIPLLVRYPELIAPESTRSQLALNIDVAPTLLELAGVPTPQTMQGRSLVPLFKDPGAPLRHAFFYAYYQEGGVPGIPTMHGVRTEHWKYIHYPTLADDIDELYDLQNDPYELHNLVNAPEHQDQLTTMKKELDCQMKEADYHDAPPPKPVEVPLKLALHYAFQRTAGNTIRDESGRKHDGVLRKARIEKGTRGSMLVLDGKGFVTVTDEDKTLDPSRMPLSVGGWCRPETGDGVLISYGGQSHGFSLYLKDRFPHFAVVSGGTPFQVRAADPIKPGEWVHLLGILTSARRLQVFVNGKCCGETKNAEFLSVIPNDGCVIGADPDSGVGNYESPLHWHGQIGEIRLYWGQLSVEQASEWGAASNTP